MLTMLNSNNTKKTALYFIIIISCLLFATIAYAQTEMPMLPAFYYGSATVNGRSIPVNSKVNGATI